MGYPSRRLLHDVEHGDAHGLTDGVIEVVRGVAGDGNVVGTGLLEPLGNLDHLGLWVGFCVVEDVGGAVRDLWVVEHDHRDVVLIGGCGGLLDDRFHEECGCQWPHPTDDAEDWSVHMPAPSMLVMRAVRTKSILDDMRKGILRPLLVS